MEPQIYIAPGPFELETGHTLPELRIAYHTYGTMNAAKDNVVWVCHALTANSDVADWWPHTVETGRFLDPARHFVVCANIIGSHYGSTGPLHVNPTTGKPWYKDFPPFTIRDIVRAHRLLADPTLLEIAAAHGKSAAQVVLRWELQRGILTIPGSSDPAHIRENISVFDFALTEDEMRRIAALERAEKHDWY